MGTIYQCLKRDDRYTPPMMTVVHEAKSSSDAVRWLENNGGGIFRDLLHNFDCGVAAKGRLMKVKTADLTDPTLLEAVEALEKMKTSFEDLLNGYPERELHEPYQVTLNRANNLLEKLN